jgi:hypothetical protein
MTKEFPAFTQTYTENDFEEILSDASLNKLKILLENVGY